MPQSLQLWCLVHDDYWYATDHNRIKRCYHRDASIQKGIGKQACCCCCCEDCIPPACSPSYCRPGVRVKWGPPNLGTPVPISLVLWGPQGPISLGIWASGVPRTLVIWGSLSDLGTKGLCSIYMQ